MYHFSLSNLKRCFIKGVRTQTLFPAVEMKNGGTSIQSSTRRHINRSSSPTTDLSEDDSDGDCNSVSSNCDCECDFSEFLQIDLFDERIMPECINCWYKLPQVMCDGTLTTFDSQLLCGETIFLE